MRIFPSSMIARRSKLERGWVRMRLRIGCAKNAPTLFWIGAIASARSRQKYCSYSFTQKSRTAELVTRPTAT